MGFHSVLQLMNMNPIKYDPLKRPVVMENVEVTGLTYAYEISEEDMEYIEYRDLVQWGMDRKSLNTLLTETTDASRAGYFYNGHHIYFDLQSRHCSHESLQEVVDHVNMYIEGLDCHWITGAME